MEYKLHIVDGEIYFDDKPVVDIIKEKDEKIDELQGIVNHYEQFHDDFMRDMKQFHIRWIAEENRSEMFKKMFIASIAVNVLLIVWIFVLLTS